MLAFDFLLLVASVMIGYFLGYYLTEVFDLQRFKVFQFKMLICRPCLSFHIAWVCSTITGLLAHSWWMVAIGIVFALFLFIGLKIDQAERTITTEELDRLENEER